MTATVGNESAGKSWRGMAVPFVVGAAMTQLLWLLSGSASLVGWLMLPNLGVFLAAPLLLASDGRLDSPIPGMVAATIGNGLAYCGIWWLIKRARAGVSWPRWVLGIGGFFWLSLASA